jgi:hypothetical protein
MPIHDWSRASPGTFHDFHCSWIVAIRNALNDGRLPPYYYAMAEQVAGVLGPDVRTLQAVGTDGEGDGPLGSEAPDGRREIGIPPAGATAVAVAPPRVRFTARAELDVYVRQQRTLVIRHASGDRIVALVEIISPGNKTSRHALRSLVDKALAALTRGYHLLIIDLQPPTPRDPAGIHGAIWLELGEPPYLAPPDQPLTLASYAAGLPMTAYVEPIAVGAALPDMPLFLEPEWYVPVPLEATYQAAWHGTPRRWRDVLEPPGRNV